MTMITLEGIPGTLSEAVRHIRWIGQPDDPVRFPGSRFYRADVSDGFLTAMLSRDQSPEWNKPLWHLSVSHRDKKGDPDRCPTFDELKHAFYRLVQADVPFVLIFPRRSAGKKGTYLNHMATCLHLWESTEPALDY